MIERTYDENFVKSIALSGEILPDLLQDNESIHDCGFDFENKVFLKYKDFGVFILKPLTNTVLDIHPVFLKKGRSEAKKAMKLALEWINNNCGSHVNKVVAQFPEYRKEISFYASQCGFKKEGINRASFLKGGEFLDQVMVGITRGEICQAL
jgi:hypothetical protein